MGQRASSNEEPKAAGVLRSPGYWMVAAMALLQAVYALQALINPDAFAASRGTPLANPGDTAWVITYASRTIFVSLIVAFLLARGALSTLRWVALLAVVMPIGDLSVALEADAPRSIVLRHIGTIAYLVLTSAVITHRLRKSIVKPL